MAAAAGTAKARYDKLASDRTQFLQRARHNALLTIPSLMPLEGHTNNAHLIEPYQGLGSRAIVHLSSRMLVGFLPAGRPFMRMDLPPSEKVKMGGEVRTDIVKGLALSEQLVQSEVEAKAWRQATLMTLQQLIVAGSVIEYLQPDNSIRVYRLDQFVVRRDHLGRILECIIQEKFPREAAPQGSNPPTTSGSAGDEDNVELYTTLKFEREGGREFYRRTYQWHDGSPAGAPTTWAVDDVPYLALRWSATPGEDYGRSKVEEHIADLRSLDNLEKAQLEMAGMASRNFIMVAPGANASSVKNRLVRALNGDVLVGDPESVGLKSFDNAAGYQITSNQVAIIRESLANAFLLMSAGQRDAERVTATEIERDIAELEAALGGTFSSLSQEMMEARTRILMKQMQAQKKLPQWEDGSVVPTILTGLEALSRERDVGRALQAAQIVQAFGEQAVDVVKLDKIIGRAYVGLGFPDSVRTEQEASALREQRIQQQAIMSAAEKTLPGVAKEVAKQEVSNGNS